MKTTLRKITLFLALVMLFVPVLSACMNNNDDDDGDYSWELGDEGRAAVPDNLPDDLDYNGYEVKVFFRYGFTSEADGFDGDGADPIHAITYQRNKKIEHRLNVKFKWTPSNDGRIPTTEDVNRILNTFEYYDFIITTNNTIVNQKKNAFLCVLDDSRYLDFSQPWWWTDFMDEIAFDGITYNFAVGDLNISNFGKFSAMFVNFKLTEELDDVKMNAADFYKLVDDKEWTLEKFYSITKFCYKDSDNALGSGTRDQSDIFGFAWSGHDTIRQMMFSTSIVNGLYTRNDDFTVTLTLENNDDIRNLTELLKELVYNNDGAWDKRTGNGTEESNAFDYDIVEEFSKGNYVFLAYRLGGATRHELRNMKDDFGILPYPTLYEGDDYVSCGESSASCICVPIVVQSTNRAGLDRAGAVIEALCAESYRYTIDAYYKDALQTKYTRDPDSVRMIDIIYETKNKNFLVEYGTVANSITYDLYRSIGNIVSVDTILASSVSSAQNALNTYIREVLESRKTSG